MISDVKHRLLFVSIINLAFSFLRLDNTLLFNYWQLIVYLSKVKLSGFKSFVDHTVFELTDRLNGIVGPNGCGKSNIIDAIRWVMGESSAKQLRGESMADVIFSGATSRKASSFASIELVFDNTDGRIGGQWSTFSEISIKRVLERSGQSTYFLNGAKCRRRDITDIFLGTGLGSRSYAIIEQGMISRIVESKPDELRLVFEEAAGVSKYKEQKRETETRIEHTRQNLLRLLDVREELTKQLEHLEKQAKKAEEYQVLKREERLLQYLSLKQKKAELTQDQTALQTRIDALQKEFHEAVDYYNDLIIKHNANKTSLTDKSALLTAQTELHHAKQKEILTLQHKIESFKTLQARTTADQNEIQIQLQQIEAEIAAGEIALETLEGDQIEKSESLIVLNESLFELNEALMLINETFDNFIAQSKTVNEEISLLERKADVAKNSITHFETKQIHDEGLITKLTNELAALTDNDASADREIVLAEQLDEKKIALDELQENVLAEKDQLSELSQKKSLLENAIHKNVRQQSEYDGRLSALTLLQNALIAQSEENIEPFYEALTLDPRWQKAAEVVLARFLTLSIHENTQGYVLGKTAFTFTPEHLGYYVKSDHQLGALLSNVYVAESVRDAMNRRESLLPHEYIVLENGDLYGADWFISHEVQVIQGVLERAEEMSQLEIQLEELTMAITVQEEEKAAIQEVQENLKVTLLSLEQALEKLKAEVVALEKELAIVMKERAHIVENQTRIEKELAALQLAHQNGQMSIEENRVALESSLSLLEEKQISKASLETHLMQYEENKKAKSSEQQSLSQKVNEETRNLDSVQFKLQETSKSLTRLKQNQAHLTLKLQEKQAALEDSDEMIIIEEELMIHHEVLLEIDGAKSELSDAVLQLQTSLTQEEQLKESQEKHIASQKEMIQSLMVRDAEFKAHEEHVVKSWESLLDTLSEEEQQSLSQEMIEIAEDNIDDLLKSVQSKLSRIGAVNLIAIDECKVLSERKTYLDEQDLDLNKALFELETAIAKIDQETKDRFMQTFNAVNEDFSKLFPRLFGGGEAYLELKGEDALVSGVNIIARPPGKKPGTIHLLSGGEKALTAAALVFAIFNLNPAPFCILDEVDAPLDEANVRRLGTLLQEMCDKVQFIFITHNKTTMSIAESLIGVTMSEPGVSRLVSVDLAEAAKMAE